LQETKKGGPYNKTDQDSKRNEVGRLYFEYGYSARKIAEVMKVNRNTINADIKYLYSNIKEEIKENCENFVLRQIGRLEVQRNRITDGIRENEIDDKIKYEKLLLEVDSKINNLLSKINLESKENEQSIIGLENDKVQEEKIRDLILFLLIKHCGDHCLKEEIIIGEIVNLQQCTMKQAKTVFSQIQELGLECSRKFRSSEFVYDLLEFSYLRRYLSPSDEFVVKISALYILDMQQKAEKITLNKRYFEKYGNKEKWTDETFAKHSEDENKQMKKFAETTGKIITEALESLSNQERINECIKYINVFFGKEKKESFEEIFG